jgi:hypothetical protein
MHDLARERNAFYRVAVFERPIVIFAHALEERCLAGFDAVLDFAPAAPTKGEEKPRVDSGGGGDPFIVGSREA